MKEKFGSLRAYICVPRGSGVNPDEIAIQDAAYALEHKYEALSQSVCELCGRQGANTPSESGWWRTRCGDCPHERRVT